MIVTERKSKYKTKVIMPRSTFWGGPKYDRDIYVWCEQMFGPGGRKHCWRAGWTEKDTVFYFRNQEDATMFALKWG